ncbi:Uncharacterised protein [Vibrio cholerae]|nr:Uncharacterised protein [Vibrio cholerae]
MPSLLAVSQQKKPYRIGRQHADHDELLYLRMQDQYHDQ